MKKKNIILLSIGGLVLLATGGFFLFRKKSLTEMVVEPSSLDPAESDKYKSALTKLAVVLKLEKEAFISMVKQFLSSENKTVEQKMEMINALYQSGSLSEDDGVAILEFITIYNNKPSEAEQYVRGLF
jgi:LPXTG-motif cell wall-anchored protein